MSDIERLENLIRRVQQSQIRVRRGILPQKPLITTKWPDLNLEQQAKVIRYVQDYCFDVAPNVPCAPYSYFMSLPEVPTVAPYRCNYQRSTLMWFNDGEGLVTPLSQQHFIQMLDTCDLTIDVYMSSQIEG